MRQRSLIGPCVRLPLIAQPDRCACGPRRHSMLMLTFVRGNRVKFSLQLLKKWQSRPKPQLFEIRREHYRRKTGLRQVPGALGEGHFTLGEGFAKCRTRRRALGEDLVGEAIFAECQISSTWRSLRQVPKSHLAKMTASGFSVLFVKWDFGTR